jgi:hypothetical protein
MRGRAGSIGDGKLPGRKWGQKSMLPTFSDKFPPTSKAAIEAFEHRRKLKLPESYRQFLLACNGGRPKQSVFPIEGLDLNPHGAVHFFFGVDTGEESYDLAEIYDWFHPSIPKGVIPVGCTAGADYICLDLRTGEERVAFWDHRQHWGTGEWREEDLYHVADSFSEFLSGLLPNMYPDNDP